MCYLHIHACDVTLAPGSARSLDGSSESLVLVIVLAVLCVLILIAIVVLLACLYRRGVVRWLPCLGKSQAAIEAKHELIMTARYSRVHAR